MRILEFVFDEWPGRQVSDRLKADGWTRSYFSPRLKAWVFCLPDEQIDKLVMAEVTHQHELSELEKALDKGAKHAEEVIGRAVKNPTSYQ